ncbi:ADP-ribosylation factor-like protein 8A [Pyrus ussuriensis x Pyrus communis]|uniref:ADP-ribosylation factor-like protein 8A n=1 Tax=Pyrus ussuriensis x Pyrus communis TaxID=2448454 RepID=A0A5N5I2N8_9ROSA|nr:ADP-ribosylation factor-like protein 8A [Pyrus ussuriensis x Pyrus communis]
MWKRYCRAVSTIVYAAVAANCDNLQDRHTQVNTRLIGHMIREKFNDPNMVYNATDVVRDIKTTLGVTISYKSASQAR